MQQSPHWLQWDAQNSHPNLPVPLMWTLETLCTFSLPKITDIDQYLLNLFEIIVWVGFFWTIHTYIHKLAWTIISNDCMMHRLKRLCTTALTWQHRGRSSTNSWVTIIYQRHYGMQTSSRHPTERRYLLSTLASCFRCPERWMEGGIFEFHHFLGHVLYFTWAWTSFFCVLSPNCILPYSNSALHLRFLSALFRVQFLLLTDCLSWHLLWHNFGLGGLGRHCPPSIHF